MPVYGFVCGLSECLVVVRLPPSRPPALAHVPLPSAGGGAPRRRSARARTKLPDAPPHPSFFLPHVRVPAARARARRRQRRLSWQEGGKPRPQPHRLMGLFLSYTHSLLTNIGPSRLAGDRPLCSALFFRRRCCRRRARLAAHSEKPAPLFPRALRANTLGPVAPQRPPLLLAIVYANTHLGARGKAGAERAILTPPPHHPTSLFRCCLAAFAALCRYTAYLPSLLLLKTHLHTICAPHSTITSQNISPHQKTNTHLPPFDGARARRLPAKTISLLLPPTGESTHHT